MTSCNNTLGRKKLNLKTVENKEILVETYNISEITTIHQFIDITNKRWHKVERIFEANDNTVDSIFIKKDSLFLRTTYRNPIVYDLASIKFGYKIILVEPKD